MQLLTWRHVSEIVVKKRPNHRVASPASIAKAPTYIHIPKTGGTYLMQLESGAGAVLGEVQSFGHSYVIDQAGDLNPVYLKHHLPLAREAVIPRRVVAERFVFSTVRNIFSWLVSYAGHAGGWNPKYENSLHYDYANARRGFDYLVKTIANRDDQWPNRKLIHCQLFSSGTDLVVDHINRQENLDDDLADLALNLRIGYQKKGTQRMGGARKDFREYYTDELIELVSTTWNRELELFGYAFDGSDKERAVIKGSMTKELKAAIRYCWKTDTLTISGRQRPRR